MATLSLREDQIMRLLVEEYSEKQIAITLKIARSTVKSHKETLYEKVGVRSLVGLVKYFNKLKASPQRIESLSGYWLSRFDFEQYVPDPSSPEQRFRAGEQINLELIEVSAVHPYFAYRGKSVCGVRSESLKVYEHEFHIRVVNQIAVGVWENSNSHNVGCFQLFIQDDGNGMYGRHLGNTSARVVKAGDWLWIKAETPPAFSLDCTRFRSFSELTAIVDAVRDTGRRLSAKELFR